MRLVLRQADRLNTLGVDGAVYISEQWTGFGSMAHRGDAVMRGAFIRKSTNMQSSKPYLNLHRTRTMRLS